MPTVPAGTRLRDVFDSGRELADHLEVQSEILRLAPFGVVIANEAGVICGVNRHLRNKLGYIWRSELVGNNTPVEALLPDEFAVEHKKLRDEWFRNPTAPMLHGGSDKPFYAKHKTGKKIRCLVAVLPMERARCGDMICVDESADDSNRYAVTFLVFPDDFAGDFAPPSGA